MPEYLHPGVYIEEIERGPKPVEGVPTSTAAILGETERGSITPRLVTSYKDYQRWFGNVFHRDKYVPYAANGFFENGGKRAYICRLVGEDAKTAVEDFGGFEIRASGAGEWGNRVIAKVEASQTTDKDNKPIGFRLLLGYWDGDLPSDVSKAFAGGDPRPAQVEIFEDLVSEESSPDYFGKRVPFIDLAKGESNQGPESSALAVLVRKATTDAKALPAFGAKLLQAGKEASQGLDTADYQGKKAADRRTEQGLAALEMDPYRDVALVYAPALADKATQQAIITHCENLRFRFAVLDGPRSDPSTSYKPRNAVTDTSHAAVYYPWLLTSDPKTGALKLTPPGGHVLGVYARSDTERGVFKAPANEVVRGAVGVEWEVNDGIQDQLNPDGVNAIRSLSGRGIRVWGARTLTSNALWKYVSVRRLFIFLERSIYEGTQWVVFEPNNDQLWARVVDTIRLFLRTQWRLGALLGRTEQEAFFITCDRTTMSQDDILNGRLVCEIGIAPTRPAEFVIFRIFQNTAEAQR